MPVADRFLALVYDRLIRGRRRPPQAWQDLSEVMREWYRTELRQALLDSLRVRRD
jgi:hypothetical protein